MPVEDEIAPQGRVRIVLHASQPAAVNPADSLPNDLGDPQRRGADPDDFLDRQRGRSGPRLDEGDADLSVLCGQNDRAHTLPPRATCGRTSSVNTTESTGSPAGSISLHSP